MRRLTLFAAALCLMLATGCPQRRQSAEPEPTPGPEPAPGPEPTPEPEPEPTPDPEPESTEPAPRLRIEEGIASSINHLGVDLYRQISQSPGNVVFSPMSISTALAMTYGGARGETAEQMAKTLHFTMPAGELHQGAEHLMETAGSEGRRAYTLRIANRLYGEETFEFQDSFLEMTRERYHAPLEQVDFRGAFEPARAKINGWVERQTNEKVQNLLPAGALDTDTRLVLVNALYFNGPWEDQFTEAATRREPFHRAAGDSVDVQTMHRTGMYWYGTAEGVRILGIPYAGGELMMTIILPEAQNGLAAVESSLTPEVFQGWLEAASSMERVAVALPRFRIEPSQSMELKPMLIALGMTRAFGRSADFTGIADPPSPDDRLFIDEVYHRAFIDVAEEGTEAAAATAVVMARAGAAPAPEGPLEFRADRPFLYAIQHRASHAVLFMGRVADPS